MVLTPDKATHERMYYKSVILFLGVAVMIISFIGVLVFIVLKHLFPK